MRLVRLEGKRLIYTRQLWWSRKTIWSIGLLNIILSTITENDLIFFYLALKKVIYTCDRVHTFLLFSPYLLLISSSYCKDARVHTWKYSPFIIGWQGGIKRLTSTPICTSHARSEYNNQQSSVKAADLRTLLVDVPLWTIPWFAHRLVIHVNRWQLFVETLVFQWISEPDETYSSCFH